MDETNAPTPSLFTPRVAAACAAILLVAAVGLRLLGREWLSDSGFGVWSGARTPNTSQWIADPYSPSHVLHGIFLFWLLVPLARWLSPRIRLIAAVLLESSWELLENSPTIIERYRANTVSLDYFGDSILNSSCDILCALLGFWLAWRFGWKWTLALVVVVELAALYFIRDNLTLNILMLIHPSDAVKQWQAGG